MSLRPERAFLSREGLLTWNTVLDVTIILTYTYLSRDALFQYHGTLAPYCKYEQTRKELNIQLRRVGLVTRVKQCKQIHQIQEKTSHLVRSNPPCCSLQPVASGLKKVLEIQSGWKASASQKAPRNWDDFFLKIKKSVCSGSKCHSISFRCMSSVLFSSEHLKYLHLVWYHLLTLSQEKEAIKTLTVGTSQLHYCMCVCVRGCSCLMIAHKALVAKMIKVVLERARAHCLAVEVEHVSGNEFKEQVIYGLVWLASCPFSNLLNIIILKLH